MRQRVSFKTAVRPSLSLSLSLCVSVCLSVCLSIYLSPACLNELCVPVEGVCSRSRLKSVSTRCVQLSRVQTSIGQLSFAFHGPSVWNSLASVMQGSGFGDSWKRIYSVAFAEPFCVTSAKYKYLQNYYYILSK